MYNKRCASARAGIAQLVEHLTRNEGVVSSSLISGSAANQKRPMCQLVSRILYITGHQNITDALICRIQLSLTFRLNEWEKG